eukprot:m.177353 g.177353  ORF g.177353 m.177353 type:complete len:850 (-) comp9970_c1_seq15:263-2812(-)
MFSVQRQVFASNDERLLAMIPVHKVAKGIRGKLNKHNLLCLTVKKNLVSLHKVRVTTDQKGEVYSKRKTWPLYELKTVDGVDPGPANKEFVLVLEKPYRWIATDAAEKNSFLFSLWKLCAKYLDGVPQFQHVNISEPEDDGGPAFVVRDTNVSAVDAVPTEPQDYKELTAAEERDIEDVLSGHNWAECNAEALTSRLASELEGLEAANIHAILASERQVDALIEDIDRSLEALSAIETTIDSYEGILKRVRKDVYRVADVEKNTLLENSNYERLTKEVEILVSQLDLPRSQERALQSPDFETRAGIRECAMAAHMIQEKLNITLQPGMSALDVVQKRTQFFKELARDFANNFLKHCKQLFTDQAKERPAERTTALALPDHSGRFEELEPLGPLLQWLHGADPESRFSRFSALCEHYCKSMNPIYARDIKVLADNFRATVQSSSRGSAKSSDDLLNRRMQYAEAFGRISNAIVTTVNAEQHFTQDLFGLAGKPVATPTNIRSSRESLARLDAEADGETTPASAASKPSFARSTSQESATAMDVVRDVFIGLENELLNIVDFSDKIDTFNSVSMFIKIERHLRSGQLLSFLNSLLGRALVVVKRLVDAVLETRVHAMTDFKIAANKSRVGILSFVHQTAEFIRHAEEVHGVDKERHSAIVKLYTALLDALVTNIERVSLDGKHQDVIVFENFHVLFDHLSRLKVDCLKPYRPVAQDKYRKHLDQYVQTIIGDPLEKLTVFFDGVQALIASGVPMEEVGFQFAYSKQELRARLKEYPGKEVRKGIEQMYKRVERHLSDEGNLRVVVLRSMQEEFVKRYTRFTQLMEQCYPLAQIKFEFTLEDLMGYFADFTK